MPAKTVERAPQVACYKCGNTDIYSVCHHCATPMCERHSRYAFRVGGTPARDPGASGKPASSEYGGLKLDSAHAAVYHCDDHYHVVRMPGRVLIIAGVIFVVGLIMALVITLLGILILLIGAAIGVYGLVKWREAISPLPGYLARLRVDGFMKSREDRDKMADSAPPPPPLPLFPHVRVAQVVEHLSGRVDLTESGYQSTPGNPTGTVTFAMTHSDWQDRLRQYRRKYGLADEDEVAFNAGFALLQGPTGMTFAAAQPLVLDAGTGLWFRGEASDHDLFAAAEGRHEGEWNPAVSYQLQESRKPATIPLWIVPSLVPSSDQRTLEIDLHWTPLLDQDGPTIELFDRIQLFVPAEWGNMESAEPGNATTSVPTRENPQRVIEWQQVPPVETDQYEQLQQRRSRSLRIRFEKRITPNSALAGRIEATFEKTLSGVTGVGLFLPGGGQAERQRQLAPSAKTEVSVDFSVSLSAIRYQDYRVVPDETNPEDLNRSRLVEFAGVIPDSGVIMTLTDALSRDDYYVKSVVEHEPFSDLSQANLLKRVWDVSGRFYTGVFPIDFDINVSGVETQGAPGVAAGRANVQVTVKGSYATGGNADGKLKESIEQKWDDLHGKVSWVFSEARAQVFAGAGAVTGQPVAITAEVIERGEPVAPPVGQPEVVDAVSVSASANGDAPGSSERRDDLMRQWKVADEAVLTGRISDEAYRSMTTRIKTELKSLGEDLGE